MSECVVGQGVSHSHTTGSAALASLLLAAFNLHYFHYSRGRGGNLTTLGCSHLASTSADSVDTNAPHCTLSTRQPIHNNTLCFSRNMYDNPAIKSVHNNIVAHICTYVRSYVYTYTHLLYVKYPCFFVPLLVHNLSSYLVLMVCS